MTAETSLGPTVSGTCSPGSAVATTGPTKSWSSIIVTARGVGVERVGRLPVGVCDDR